MRLICFVSMSAACILQAATFSAVAEEHLNGEATSKAGWSEFRNGGASHTFSSDLPVEWSPDSTVAWQRELPGYGQSVPVIHGSRIFLTAVIGPMKDECAVVCLDLHSGKELWSHSFPNSTPAASNYSASRAAPTPIVDPTAVYAFFEGGDLIAMNHNGKVLWQRSLTKDYGEFRNGHGLGCSPTQTAELMVLNIEHQGPSYLLAVNKSDGTTRWKTERKSASSWTSPIVMTCDGKQQVVVSSGGTVDGYDVVTGNQLWTVGGLGGNSIASPTAVGPYVFIGARVPEFGSAADAVRSNLCIRVDQSMESGYEIAWRATKAVCDYASPVVDRDSVYYLNNVGVLYCLDSTTGEPHYTERLGSPCWATPIVSGDRIYFFGKDGTTHVLKTGPEFVRVPPELALGSFESSHAGDIH